jgi:transposase-like protein/transposase
MNNIYRKKSYTQYHIRQSIVDKHNNWVSAHTIMEHLNVGSTKTIYHWVNTYKETWSLEDKSSAPKNPHRKYELHELYNLYAYKKYLNLPLDEIIDKLEEIDIIFKRSSASYYLNQWKLTKKFKPKPYVWKFKDYDVGYLHIDITYWPNINWIKQYIYVAIDRKTRLLYIEVHTNKEAETAANFLRRAIEFFPFKIEYILTDNWKEFSLKNHKWKYDLEWAFDKVCKEFDIEHRLTRPYTPKTNWMVEKANDTIKNWTVNIHHYDTAEEMKQDILLFMIYYNLNRRHSWIYTEIRKKTPFEALEYYYSKNSEKFKESPIEFRRKLDKLLIN